MVNKVIAIVDLDSFHNQNIETLLFASILEKKVNKLSVLDLNHHEQDALLPKLHDWKKEGEILTISLFNNTLYKICSQVPQNPQKLLNLAKTINHENDILIINVNSQRYEFNSMFYAYASDIVIFADMDKNVSSNIVNLFMQHNIKSKNIYIVVHNYKDNIQGHKAYLQLLKSFRAANIKILLIDKVPEFSNLKEIENIDPWLEIYKKINSTF